MSESGVPIHHFESVCRVQRGEHARCAMSTVEDGEKRLVGWDEICRHLNKRGRRTSKSYLQKLGRKSVGRFNSALIGYFGPHPVSTPRLAEDWWDNNLQPVSDIHQAAGPEPMEACAK